MASYLLRRLGVSLLILLGASFLVYMLVSVSGDPLAEYRTSNKPNKEQLMAARIALLHLNVPAPARYFVWLSGAVKCVVPGKCDLGKTISGQPVTAALGSAIPSTLQLVTAAILLAIVIGVAIGIVTALRQYSGFDYTVTFFTFLFFSLPSFWVAVLLKEFGAIKFNDFLGDPKVSTTAILVIALLSGIVWALIIGGTWRRRGLTFVIAAAAAAAVVVYLEASKWFQYPGLGAPLVIVFGVAIAVGVTVLLAGLQHRKALYS
ncbi:MAG: ABC transporter permease, partial [Cellulomonas sp.]|nr:ABC transporter permease [Cellulomonas sp.]